MGRMYCASSQVLVWQHTPQPCNICAAKLVVHCAAPLPFSDSTAADAKLMIFCWVAVFGKQAITQKLASDREGMKLLLRWLPPAGNVALQRLNGALSGTSRLSQSLPHWALADALHCTLSLACYAGNAQARLFLMAQTGGIGWLLALLSRRSYQVPKSR